MLEFQQDLEADLEITNCDLKIPMGMHPKIGTPPIQIQQDSNSVNIQIEQESDRMALSEEFSRMRSM